MKQFQKTSVQDQFVVFDAQKTLAPQRQQRGFIDMVGNPDAAVQPRSLWGTLAPQWRRGQSGTRPLQAFQEDAGRHDAYECITRATRAEVDSAGYYGPREMHYTIALLIQHANALESELRSKTQDYEHRLCAQNARLAALSSAQTRLESLAGQDELTGLPNRRTFTDRLTQAVKRASRTGSSLAVLFIGLDSCDDRYGHDTGDQVLRQVAERLNQCIRSSDTVCRWGGDEFALVTENTDQAQGNLLAQRIITALDKAIVIGDASIHVSASIGLCLYPDDGRDAETLVRNADTAMYRAKRSGKTGSTKLQSNGADAPTLLTVEDAANMLGLSRPHVFKLIAERRFNHVIWQGGKVPLIPLSEVSRMQEAAT